ncbi:hypothetical protein TrLO_g9279 [Triparma laevis f. longispina]|uniref:Thioredoxin domain-containing protein n=1 Tax=Triparma laevis f. longispina TaxID=1714387 RepID=A0A9W7KZ37_9STRA|nr:hypothetical protein TrLO_g9279 [Triparma laevis f. longispina]
MSLLIAFLLRLLNTFCARDASGDLTIGLTNPNTKSFSTVTNPDLDSPLSSPATLRGSEATHVPILTSDNGHKALHLDYESNVFVYFYASKTYPASTSHALSFVQTYSKTSSLPNLNLYRVDCDSPLSQFLCFEESITAFPCFIYYKGDDEGVQWLPKKQGFDGKLYEQGFESVFMVDFIKEELIQVSTRTNIHVNHNSSNTNNRFKAKMYTLYPLILFSVLS